MTETELIRKRFTQPVQKHWPSGYIQKIGGSVFKSGQPDIFAVLEGLPFVLEGKREGGKVTGLQWEHLQNAHRSGATAGVLFFKESGEIILYMLPGGATALVAEIAKVIRAEVCPVEDSKGLLP